MSLDKNLTAEPAPSRFLISHNSNAESTNYRGQKVPRTLNRSFVKRFEVPDWEKSVRVMSSASAILHRYLWEECDVGSLATLAMETAIVRF
jgi:hypothetical protein